ncbi:MULTISPECIES: ABC-2 family transporter protein [Actinosynnema]|uniref:ABC transporter permease n=1 Tax=Actinosynnema TaxID=40566 RepID=UPI0020A28A98|nr:ABC-2 family transporter protein [Actinosynnema pretiosum]
MGGVQFLATFYARAIRFAISRQFQYRVTNYLVLTAMFIESLIYLALWHAATQASGGSVGGWSTGALSAYFLVWMLVRNMVIAFTPYGFSARIESGQFSSLMLRPMHPIHHDIAAFAGWKLVMIAFWLPVATVLALVVRPELSVTPLGVTVFVVAAWGAYLIRALYLWLLGLTSFWTTRSSAFFDVFLVVEILLSGRMMPMSLLPQWLRDVAELTPFPWTFGFPVESLLGTLTTDELLHGLVMQLVWIAVASAAVALVWRRAVRRHTSVGH